MVNEYIFFQVVREALSNTRSGIDNKCDHAWYRILKYDLREGIYSVIEQSESI
jgi:hypothetical protein